MELSIGQTDMFAEFNSGAPVKDFIVDFLRKMAKTKVILSKTNDCDQIFIV